MSLQVQQNQSTDACRRCQSSAVHRTKNPNCAERSNKATFVKTSVQVDYECFASCFEKRYIWVAANCGSLLVDTQILLLPANDLWSKDNGSLVNQAVSDG